MADTRPAGVTNVFADDWEEIYPPTEGWRSNTRRLVPGGPFSSPRAGGEELRQHHADRAEAADAQPFAAGDPLA